MSFNAVVFDMDGVIFDSETKVIECWQEIAARHSIPGIEAACHECLGLNYQATRERMLARYGGDFPYDIYKKEMSDLFHSRYDDGRLPLKPGVRELLSFLKEHGKKIALASSTSRAAVTRELQDAGLYEYFDQVVCGDMVAHSKPAPDIFAKACNLLKVDTQHAYGIEDSYNGIRSAHAAGLRPIMAPDQAPPTAEMEHLSEVILPDLIAVREYLLQRLK